MPVKPRRSPCRSGFVLLMSLVLIALAGMILAGLARHSLLIAAETSAAQRDLQRRWGTVFLAQALLAEPESRVASQFDAHAAPASQLPIVKTLRLGSMVFEVRLDDENRKLNINRLRASAGTRRLMQVIQRSRAGGRVELVPLPPGKLGIRQFDSWGHVFALPTGLDSARTARERLAEMTPLTDRLTCWGNGKVNLRRCSNAVLHTVATFAAGPLSANRLVALRADEPELGRDEMLAKLAVNRTKQLALKNWLSEQSGCYSVWIVAGQQRPSVDFYVREDTGSGAFRTKHFKW